VLRGEEEFAPESALGGAAVQGFFGRNSGSMRVVVLLGEVGENKVACAGIEAVGIREILTDRMIGKMAGTGEDALLDDPRVGADLEHVEIMIGFEDEAIGFAEMDFDELGHVTKIGADGDLGAVGAEGEGDGVDGVVRNGEGVDVDVTDAKALAGLNGFDAAKAFAKSFGKNAPEGAHGGLGDVERSFPEGQDLREAVAMIGVLVGDEDRIEVIKVAFDGSETGKRFALAKAGVHKDAGAIRFEQSQIARTSGRENGDTQADGGAPRKAKLEKRNVKLRR